MRRLFAAMSMFATPFSCCRRFTADYLPLTFTRAGYVMPPYYDIAAPRQHTRLYFLFAAALLP